MRRFLSLLLIVIFSFGLTNVTKAEYTSLKLNKISAVSTENLGEFLKDIQILGCDTAINEDGDSIYYAATSGSPAKFFAYNLDKRAVVDEKDLQIGSVMGTTVYAVNAGPDGRVYIATQGTAALFIYTPDTKELKCYGRAGNETAVMCSGCFDAYGNYYFGTYPNACLYRYNKASDKLECIGENVVSGDYIHAISSYGNKLFMGGLLNADDNKPLFVKYDADTNEFSKMPLPSKSGVFTSEQVTYFYASSTAGKYMFSQTRYKISETSEQYIRCVLDMENEVWTDAIPSTIHLHVSDMDEKGYVYLVSYKSGTGGGYKICKYNPATKTKSFTSIPYTGYFVNPKLVTLKDQEKYPGVSIVAGANTYGANIINLSKGTVTSLKDDLPGTDMRMRVIETGINNDILISGYMGSFLGIYDTALNKLRYTTPMDQAESLACIDNKYYAGMYGGSQLLELNPTDDQPKMTEIATMKAYNQNRAFDISDAGDNIIWASVPNYAKRGGAVGVYNKAAKTSTVYYGMFDTQSVSSVTYNNGFIYGVSHMFCGLGIDPVVSPAKIFKMDINTGKIVYSKDITVPGCTDIQYFGGGIRFYEGKLYLALPEYVTEVDPDTLDITRAVQIGAYKITPESSIWMPFSMDFDEGILYTNVGKQITAVDVSTFETKLLAKAYTGSITLGNDKNIYYMSNSNKTLSRVNLSYPGQEEKAMEMFKLSKENNRYYLSVSSSYLPKKAYIYKTEVPEDATITLTEEKTDITEFVNEKGEYFAFFNGINTGNTPIVLNTNFSGGYGTDDSPYIVTEKAELLKVADYNDKCFLQTEDITEEITSPVCDFYGTYSGDGQRTINLNINMPETDSVGLFSSIANDSCISNISVTGSVIGKNYVGGIVGKTVTTTYKSFITSCKNYASITSKGGNCGGICGAVDSLGNCMTTITKCENYGDIYCTGSYGGGIVGHNRGPVTYSRNYGNVSGGYGIGGISGFLYESCTRSFNGGNVTAATIAGGISTYSRNSKNLIYSCYNRGDITGETAVGICLTGSLHDNSGGNITYCYNIGKINGSKVSGPITAVTKENNTYTIDSCYYISESGLDDGFNGTSPITVKELRSVIPGTDYAVGNNIYEFPYLKYNKDTEAFGLYQVDITRNNENEIIFIYPGEEKEITVNPDDGKYIKDISFNNVSVLCNYIGSYTYKLPALCSDSSVSILLDSLENGLSVNLYDSFFTEPNGIVLFSKALSSFNGYERGECGLLISDKEIKEESFVLSNPDIKDCKSLNCNDYMYYGIRLITPVLKNKDYFVRPYVVYEKSEDSIINYGEIVNIKL